MKTTRWSDRRTASAGHEDAPDAMREWRWRSYTDHLQDLGYDLDGGMWTPDERSAVPVQPSESSGSESSLTR